MDGAVLIRTDGMSAERFSLERERVVVGQRGFSVGKEADVVASRGGSVAFTVAQRRRSWVFPPGAVVVKVRV